MASKQLADYEIRQGDKEKKEAQDKYDYTQQQDRFKSRLTEKTHRTHYSGRRSHTQYMLTTRIICVM